MEVETRTDIHTTNPRTIDLRIVPRLPVLSEGDTNTDGVYILNEGIKTEGVYSFRKVAVVSVPILLET